MNITSEGDIVTGENEEQWRQKFCDETGHSMECVTDTVDLMATVFAKVCEMHSVPTAEVSKQITVEEFDKHIRQILETKVCDCKR